MTSAQARVSGVGIDNHTDTEAVYNYGGAIIAYRCRTCTKITCHVGTCDGCGEAGVKLTKHVTGKKPRRYCSAECHIRATSRARLEKRGLDELSGKRKAK